MACGGCKKSKESFKHRIKKAKRKELKAEKAKLTVEQPENTVAPVAPKKKRRRSLSKRARWIRQKRRDERKAAKEKTQ